jgi:hypothetical protein
MATIQKRKRKEKAKGKNKTTISCDAKCLGNNEMGLEF